MAGKAWNPSIDERLRHLEELVRRLGTRLPQQAGTAAWQSLEPYLGPGWVTDGTVESNFEHARFYVDRDRAYFAGLITYLSYLPGANATRPVTTMPTEYRPNFLRNHTLHTDPDNTASATVGMFWTIEIFHTTFGGIWQFDPNAPPTDYPVTNTVFYLDDLSYRLS